MGLLWRLNFISPSSKVDVVSKNTFLELDMSTVNLIELWKELAKGIGVIKAVSVFDLFHLNIVHEPRRARLFERSFKKQVAFQSSHKYIGKNGSQFGSHS